MCCQWFHNPFTSTRTIASIAAPCLAGILLLRNGLQKRLSASNVWPVARFTLRSNPDELTHSMVVTCGGVERPAEEHASLAPKTIEELPTYLGS